MNQNDCTLEGCAVEHEPASRIERRLLAAVALTAACAVGSVLFHVLSAVVQVSQ